MNDDKRRYKAEIAGKSYTLIGPGSTEHFAAVTQILNEQLLQIKRLQPSISREDASVLLAFNALSDLVKAEAENQTEAQ